MKSRSDLPHDVESCHTLLQEQLATIASLDGTNGTSLRFPLSFSPQAVGES